jgi:predicted ATPase
MTHGWARVKIGQADGLAEISNSVATMRQVLGGIPVVFLSSQIEAYVHLRLHAKALDLLAQALADAHRTGDGHYLAELHRLKGVCLLALAPGSAVEAELCFCQALDISRQQNAMSLALRAATSLVSLWQQQGKFEVGRSLLKEMLGAFSEGFDTPSLRDAAQQLQTLG